MISVLVGRHPNCAIVLSDPTVSRQHATIAEIEPGLYLIKDENSSCGTFVLEPAGWTRVTSARVRESDRVRLGAFETTIKSLLRIGADTGSRPVRIVERDPETGEIIVRTS